MPMFDCTCGAMHVFKDQDAGRRARCKSCGSVFTVPSPEGDVASVSTGGASPFGAEADDIYSIDDAPRRSGGLQEHSASPILPTTAPTQPVSHATIAPGARAGDEPARRTYRADVARSFTFVRTIEGAVALCVLAALYGLPAFLGPVLGLIILGGVIGGVIFLITAGMIASYSMNVIRHAAADDDDLPPFADWEGMIETVWKPLFEFYGTAVILILPALIALIAYRAPAPGEDGFVLMVTLFIVGIFLWPISLLAVALGGLGVFMRIDLLVRSVIAAFPAYVVTWLFLLLTIAVAMASSRIPTPHAGAVQQLSGAPWLLGLILTSLIGAYVTIVQMRLIGLFYRHFKDRLPWSAG